jgi:hypothetical protein
MQWMYDSGKPVTELMQMLENEPDPIRNRFLIFVGLQ